MNDRTRYQAQSVYREATGVGSYLGVDPVTGLPVLIYRFNGQASPALARLDSEHIPRLLAWRDDGDTGIMVVAWSSAWQPAGDQPLSVSQLLASARALSDAAAAGVRHGDLTAERFLTAGDTAVLEGFGVPWQQAAADGPSDVQAWAAAVRQLGHSGPAAVDRFLEEVAAAGELPAADLFSRLSQLLEPEPGPDPAAEEPAGDAYEELELSWDDPDGGSGSDDPLAAVGDLRLDYGEADDWDGSGPADSPAEPEQPPEQADDDGVFTPSADYASELLTAHAPARTSDAGAAAPVSPLPAGGSSSYIKKIGDQPVRTSVGTTGQNAGRAGSTRPGRDGFDPAARRADGRGPRRIIMIAVLLILSAVLVTLVLWLRRNDVQSVPQPMTAGVTYVIDVAVEPDNLPPVNLYVLESPAGSQLRPNTILGTAPRRMALDAEGTWVFEGRFQGRVSEPVTIRIPEERSSTVTIRIPPEAPAED